MSLQRTLITEVSIEQSIQDLYLELFNHALTKVTYSHVADNIVAIVLEDAVTLPEQVLLRGKRHATAAAARCQFNRIFERHLTTLLIDIYKCTVKDILSQHQVNSGCVSLIIVIDHTR